ncbi:hypothetical protein SAMN05421788_101499 [Filimonas lacunae]|uniref:Outer membrane protein beta-barrel domain-containing protein n=1 Tax=Filimonas lacunae TaxID=477680 RepID=A0A173MN38_9BACT|nr:hypothetical protein [Filimonas lacunae]BAV09052.1 outermembrane protein [Filimonas lacunae]SIS66491.1 hypothetical protein SAMN05421788_101499 [Filimonas lacunae]
MKKTVKVAFAILAVAVMFTAQVQAQSQEKYFQPGKKGEFYGSWGYNKEWYTASSIHVKQPGLNNDFTFVRVQAKDKPGWDENIFKQAISIPQYNYRVGYWFKDNWAFEVNFDHTKYQVKQDQLLHVKGTIDGKHVDEYRRNDDLANPQLQYQLNNGANFLLFNLVHRKQISNFHQKWFNLSLLLKGGVGVVIPHVQNTIFGQDNDQGFQFGGFCIGGEAAVRATFFKYGYLEFCNKLVGAHYYNLKVYQGRAKQTFGCYEMIANIGFSVPLKKYKS